MAASQSEATDNYWHLFVSNCINAIKAKCYSYRSSTSGLQNSLSFCSLHNMTDSIIETPEAVSNTAILCMTLLTGVEKRLDTQPSNPTLGEPKGFI